MSAETAPISKPRPGGPGARASEPAEACADRDAALRLLYEEHSAALHAYVRRLVAGDHERAADIVQETMLRAWRAGTTDAGRPSMRPWLYTVARRIVIDEHRRRSARPPETNGAVLEHLPCADETDRMLTRLAVADAMSALRSTHRQVLRELYFRRSKVDEVARTLGIPPGTVRSRAHYALQALRLALEERGITGRL